MPPKVRQVLDTAGLAQVLNSPTGATARILLDRGYKVQTIARRNCPVDSGRLRASVHVRLVRYGGILICEIGTDLDYAIYVHEGTGLFGPKHAVIRPTTAKVLVFTPRKGRTGKFIPGKNRTVVYARFVKGSPARPFLRDALRVVLR